MQGNWQTICKRWSATPRPCCGPPPGQAGEKASEARERAEESLAALRERLSGLEDVVKGRAKQVDGYVRDNPWQALAIAGGVALLVGVLMGRTN